MKNPRVWGKPLLILHLLFCCLWLYMFEATVRPPNWMILTALWSILGIPFTWGFTVGLIVGPGKAKRGSLWWSLLLNFLPAWFFFQYALLLAYQIGLFWGALFLVTFLVIIGCETFGGVILGAKAHVAVSKD